MLLLLLLVNYQLNNRKKKMAVSRYEQFKKYILFQEDFIFMTSLYFIFNEENQVKTIDNQLKFIMTYQKFKKYLKKLKEDAKNSCGIVCRCQQMCLGHQTLDLMEKYDHFMFDAVDRRGLYYKNVKFIKVKTDDHPMFGFIIIPIDEVNIGWKTWSQRMSYLRY